MKPLHNILLASLVLLSTMLWSCSKEEPTIGLLMDDYVSARWAQDEELFVTKARELGATVHVRAARGDGQLQYSQAQELIDLGATVLVVLPTDAEEAKGIVELAHKHNVVVMAYDRMITGAPLDYYISFDNVEVGKLQAEYITRRMPTGNFVLLEGPDYDNNSSFFVQGHQAILKPFIEDGSISIVYEGQLTDWKPEEAYRITKELLDRGEQIDAIIAASDDLSRGVVQALEEAGLAGKVLVTGQDADLYACRNIVAGNQIMTIYKPISALANTAAIQAVSLAQNGHTNALDDTLFNGHSKVPSILLQPISVDKDNLRANIIQDGFHTEEEIYQ